MSPAVQARELNPGKAAVAKTKGERRGFGDYIWVDVKIMVPFWVPIIIRHLIFRVPKKGP